MLEVSRQPGIIRVLEEAALEGRVSGPEGANIMVCALTVGKDDREHLFTEFATSMSEALETLGWLRDQKAMPILWAAINHLGRTRYHLEDGDIVQDYQE